MQSLQHSLFYMATVRYECFHEQETKKKWNRSNCVVPVRISRPPSLCLDLSLSLSTSLSLSRPLYLLMPLCLCGTCVGVGGGIDSHPVQEFLDAWTRMGLDERIKDLEPDTEYPLDAFLDNPTTWMKRLSEVRCEFGTNKE